MHADAAGYIGVPETAYTHSHLHVDRGGHHSDAEHHHDADHATPAHDYEGARDVSPSGLALGPSKIPMPVPVSAVLFALLPRDGTLLSADIVYPVLSGRHTRWRPPLRAPPRSA